MRFIKAKISLVFMYLACVFAMLYEKCARISTSTRDFWDKESVHDEEMKKIISSTSLDFDSFIKYPQEQAGLIKDGNPHIKEIVEVYLYAKQCIALYEARTKLTPLQVFNELRSALDHFIRALMAQNTDKENSDQHYKSMLGHVQRAFLDAAKMTCATFHEHIQKKHDFFGKKATYTALGGVYAENIDKLIYKAEQCLLDAKLNEHKLGAGKSNNEEVRNKYIHAICGFNLAAVYQQNNMGKVRFGLAKNMSSKAFSILLVIISSLISSFATYIFRYDLQEYGHIIGNLIVGLLKNYSF